MQFKKQIDQNYEHDASTREIYTNRREGATLKSGKYLKESRINAHVMAIVLPNVFLIP